QAAGALQPAAAPLTLSLRPVRTSPSPNPRATQRVEMFRPTRLGVNAAPRAVSTRAGGRRGKERGASLRAEQRLAAGGRRCTPWSELASGAGLPRPGPRTFHHPARRARRPCPRALGGERGRRAGLRGPPV